MFGDTLYWSPDRKLDSADFQGPRDFSDTVFTRDSQGQSYLSFSYRWNLVDQHLKITAFAYDYGTEKMHSITTTFYRDTTYNFDPCAQQSTYTFTPNGISQITDGCSTGQPITDTAWSIQSNKVLQIIFLEDPAEETHLPFSSENPDVSL